LAGKPENSVSPASKIPPLKKSPGARTLPDMRAAEQVIEHHAPLAFPKAGNSLPLTA